MFLHAFLFCKSRTWSKGFSASSYLRRNSKEQNQAWAKSEKGKDSIVIDDLGASVGRTCFLLKTLKHQVEDTQNFLTEWKEA